MITDHCITKSSCKFDLEADYNLAFFFFFFHVLNIWRAGENEAEQIYKVRRKEMARVKNLNDSSSCEGYSVTSICCLVFIYIYANQVEVTSDS